MIPIVIPTNDRPDYLIKVLIALFNCRNLDKFKVMTSEEPNADVSLVLDTFDLFDIERHKNVTKLGCSQNIKQALYSGLKFSDKVIILEDDIIPGSDFLNYFLWAFEKYEKNQDVLAICAYNFSVINNFPERTDITRAFNPWGWGTWRNRLFRIEESKAFENKQKSWDCAFGEYFYYDKWNLYVKPLLSRTQNIGEHGTYVPSPEWQRTNQRTPHWSGEEGSLIIDTGGFV